MGKTKSKNTHGVNAFREVRIRCAECRGTHTSLMQCPTGRYTWDCDFCMDNTTHIVTEVEPKELPGF